MTVSECLNPEDPVIKVIIVQKVRMFLVRMLTPVHRGITVLLAVLILLLVNQDLIKTYLARFVFVYYVVIIKQSTKCSFFCNVINLNFS